jgi:adenylate kinase
MEKTQDLKAGMPSTAPTMSPATQAKVAAVLSKPKAASKPKPKAKVAAKKKAAPAKKAAKKTVKKVAKKVKTNSKAMGRARVYTKELILGLVKQVKAARKAGQNMSLKKLVAKNKKLRYVPLLVASRHPSINLNLGELLGTWHRQSKKVSRKGKK